MKRTIFTILTMCLMLILNFSITCCASEEQLYKYDNQPKSNCPRGEVYCTRTDEVFVDSTTDTGFNDVELLSDEYWQASWEFSANGDTLYITGEGYVPNLAYWYDEYGNPYLSDSQLYALKHVVINGDFTSIGDYAFLNYPNLMSVTSNAPIVRIGAFAFQGCEKLSKIVFRDTLTCIGEYAFSKLFGYTGHFNIASGVQTIGEGAFWQSGISSVYIPGTVKNLGTDIFSECSNLETVIIDSGVTYIADNMFFENTSLNYVVIPDTVQSIGDYSFYGCLAIIRVDLPESIVHLGKYSFSNCPNLENFNFSSNLTTLGEGAFWQSGLKYATIPSSIDEIEIAVFAECTNLISVSIPDTVISIKDGAFEKCTSLNHITLPANITHIGKAAFASSGLTSISIPKSVKSIGKFVFSCCENLETVTIKYGVKIISESMFMRCSSLKAINLPSSVTTIEGWAFQDCSALENIVLPNSVVAVGEKAFSYCPELKTISLSGGLKEIGKAAFYKSGLTDITIPASVEILGDEVFSECLSLKNIIFEPSVNTIVPISAFESCFSLECVILPDNLTEIQDFAFCDCQSLTSIKIPESVLEISQTAFEGSNITMLVKQNSYAHRFAIKNNISYLLWGIEATISNNGKIFNINANIAEKGNIIILALYNGDKFVEGQQQVYEGKVITFTTDKVYTKAKVMVWESISNLRPVCNEKILK